MTIVSFGPSELRRPCFAGLSGETKSVDITHSRPGNIVPFPLRGWRRISAVPQTPRIGRIAKYIIALLSLIKGRANGCSDTYVLRSFTDRELKDIGLQRVDLPRGFSGPFWPI